jgi:hypothetical protein
MYTTFRQILIGFDDNNTQYISWSDDITLTIHWRLGIHGLMIKQQSQNLRCLICLNSYTYYSLGELVKYKVIYMYYILRFHFPYLSLLAQPVNILVYYIMILFKQLYWLSCCHLTFRKLWYCLIKTRIDLVSLSFSLFILM